MPIYVWICKPCTTRVERYRAKRENMGPAPLCHVCGEKMSRVLNPPALRFEGGGWTTERAKGGEDE